MFFLFCGYRLSSIYHTPHASLLRLAPSLLKHYPRSVCASCTSSQISDTDQPPLLLFFFSFFGALLQCHVSWGGEDLRTVHSENAHFSLAFKCKTLLFYCLLMAVFIQSLTGISVYTSHIVPILVFVLIT